MIVHDLKAFMRDIAQKSKKLPAMQINVLSFGFKFGIPYDADLIIDVRFLINPYLATIYFRRTIFLIAV